MTKIPSLHAGMMNIGSRRPITKPMALATGQSPVSANASLIQKIVEEAREEIGYHRDSFIRVEHPDNMSSASLMGRYREKIPKIEYPDNSFEGDEKNEREP